MRWRNSPRSARANGWLVRHAEYFRDQAHEADERWGTGSTAAWLTSVDLELDNYRAVLEWALKDGHDLALGGAVAGALGRLWSNGGLAVEGRYWIGLAQAGLDESMHPQDAARLWRALGYAFLRQAQARLCATRPRALSIGGRRERAGLGARTSCVESLSNGPP